VEAEVRTADMDGDDAVGSVVVVRVFDGTCSFSCTGDAAIRATAASGLLVGLPARRVVVAPVVSGGGGKDERRGRGCC
jgi:hypothetical protein